jgi:hypothetical protein
MSGAKVVRLHGDDGGEGFDQSLPSDAPDGKGGKRRGGGGGESPADGGGERFGAVVPLGVRTRRGSTCYVFLDAAGLETTLSAKDMHSAPIIEGLFGGRIAHRFLCERWPHFIPQRDDKGRPVRDDDGKPVMIPAGWSARECGADLISACTRIGAADDAELRRDGVWSDDKGGLVVHCGQRIFAEDREHRPGLRQGKAIYIAAPRREPPAEEPASAAECLRLEDDFRLWTYAPAIGPFAPQLLMGMVACGILSAALDWRPHMATWGPAGAGKTTLVNFVARCCGLEEASDDVSEPGIRRLFNARSGLIPLDENEAAVAQTTQVLNLMRGASSGKGAMVVRTSQDSGVDVFRVAGSFFLAAINPPHLSLADSSRITLILLRRGTTSEGRKAQLDDAMLRARAAYPRLLTRLVLGFDRYRQNLAVLRAAAIRAHATARSADQIAALLAGWQTLTQDEPVEAGDADRLVEPLGSFTTSAEDAEEEDAGRQALRHLLGSVVQVDRERLTVAQAVADGVAAIRAWAQGKGKDGDYERELDAKRWAKRLGSIGLRYHEAPRPGMLVANGAPVIDAAFAGTPWANKAWQRPLRELPDAMEPRGPVKFRGNAAARCVHLPLTLLLGEGDDDG